MKKLEHSESSIKLRDYINRIKHTLNMAELSRHSGFYKGDVKQWLAGERTIPLDYEIKIVQYFAPHGYPVKDIVLIMDRIIEDLLKSAATLEKRRKELEGE